MLDLEFRRADAIHLQQKKRCTMIHQFAHLTSIVTLFNIRLGPLLLRMTVCFLQT